MAGPAEKAFPVSWDQFHRDARALAWRLALIYLVLASPFFCVASAVGLALMGWGRRADRVYALDLTGAAGGGVLALALLWTLEPLHSLAAVAGAGMEPPSLRKAVARPAGTL